MRFAISAMDPTVLPYSMFAQASIVALHHFFTPQYWQHIKEALHFQDCDDTFRTIRRLLRGCALVYSPKYALYLHYFGIITFSEPK
jgi:hypothetical protein